MHKDTPPEIREKIVEVARKTMMSDRAKAVAAETGALVYWMDAADAAARIESDIAVTARINEMIAQ